MQVEDIYQKKTQLQHILLRPDTYVGSVEPAASMVWVLSPDGKSFVQKEITFAPALFKIFDEILVNAADNFRKDPSMNLLEVEINAESGAVSVYNNGKGIPVVIHKGEGIYVPQMIFGHLLTGSNYNDNEKKVTGGRNGYGAKLANIFSKKFVVEAADAINQLRFRMEWTNNMSEHSEAEIKQHSGRDFTKITFYPDFQRFRMQGLDPDVTALLKKRVFDMAGVLGRSVKVRLNGEQLPIKDFSQYVDMYLDDDEPVKISDKESTTSHWQVIVSISNSEFKQVSFVNSICTSRGGTHVSMLADQIVERIQQQIKKKHKDLTIKPYQIRSHLWIFVNCLIENPAFDSQTKETLTTKPSQFGSTYSFSEKSIKEILKTGIIDHIVNEAKAKELNKLAKATGGGKKAKITGIDKLEDANEAGSKNSEKCTLILTEGDSAKALAMAGLEVVGRDYYGVFPLKGKLLNVREATVKQVTDNQEIQNVIKIMGLQVGKQYDDLKSLRYGSIMIMSDQDTDGSHIKGLIINFLHHFWPKLLKEHKGFVKCFITPIIKSSRGSSSNNFYCVQDYLSWVQEVGNTKGWKIKYYKGLGTSTDKEAQEYFNELQRNRITFTYQSNEDDDAIDLCFNKRKAERRKQWLEQYDANLTVDYRQSELRYLDFVNKELIHFSNSDNMRSIPSVCDGLKPGQRKVLFACFKRNLKEEIKVAQLAGYVAEHSAYHHGEMSLAETIIGMAQNFVGTNNINLLEPIGQFGTRNHGGKEHASSRYIFTSLSRITRHIFLEADDHIVEYEQDDGQYVEPKWYLPILPMALVNGAEGIGTGWSTNIPQYDPRKICESILSKLDGGEFLELHPHYKGFQGEIQRSENGNYLTMGKLIPSAEDPSIANIVELPVGKWTRQYKAFLEEFLTEKGKEGILENFKEYHTNNRVNFELQFCQGVLQEWGDSILRQLKLVSSMSMNNLVLFNAQGRLIRFGKVEEILSEFYTVRLEGYSLRKEYLLSRLQHDLQILSNKLRFIREVIDNQLEIRNVPKMKLCQTLFDRGYTRSCDFIRIKSTKLNGKPAEDKPKEEDNSEVEQMEEDDVVRSDRLTGKDYDYLLTMPLWSLTREKVDKLMGEVDAKQKECNQLEKLPTIDMWRHDLREFLEVLDQIENEQEEERLKADQQLAGKEKDKKKAKKPRKKKSLDKGNTIEKPMKKVQAKRESIGEAPTEAEASHEGPKE